MRQARGGQHMVVVDFEKSLPGAGLSQGGAKRAQADIGAPPWGGRQGPAIDDRVQRFDVGRQQAAGRRDNLAYLRMRQRLRQDVLPHLAGGAQDQQGFHQFGRAPIRWHPGSPSCWRSTWHARILSSQRRGMVQFDQFA